MSEPSEKRFLQIEDRQGGFVINADKADAEALAAMFQGRGISCQWDRGTPPDQDSLQFLDNANRERVEEILHGYSTAKGS